MAAGGLGLVRGLRGSRPGPGRRLGPRGDKTVPGLALEGGVVSLDLG
jgi:hypothetical protein